jgi:hypothetical protein
MIFAFAGIVAFHKGADWRAQRFDTLRAKAEEKRDVEAAQRDIPDEGLVGF